MTHWRKPRVSEEEIYAPLQSALSGWDWAIIALCCVDLAANVLLALSYAPWTLLGVSAGVFGGYIVVRAARWR